MVNTLASLIEIPSFFSNDAKPGKPFGENINKALDAVLRFGSNMGFTTKNLDGYIGEVQLGCGRYMIGILCHVDVVEPGDDWATPPFTPTLIGDKLYGRGAIDDKAGIVCALYAMKYLKDHSLLKDNFSIRLIVGTDEELGWNDMAYYKKHADRFPDISLVIDANFPLIYCEKGLLDFDLTWKPLDCRANHYSIQLVKLNGGTARNAVPSKATATLVTKNATQVANHLQTYATGNHIDCDITLDGNSINIMTYGISVHAMWPEKGKSAINSLIKLLSALPKNKFSGGEFVEEYMHMIGEDFAGTNLGLSCSDKESGSLTLVVGQIKFDYESGEYTLISGLRYPSSREFNTIKDKLLSGISKFRFNMVLIDHLAPIFFKKDNPIIQTLMQSYSEITGDKTSEPLAIGGATYSRSLPNAIAFGPLFPWEKELAHEPNEFMDINNLEKACDVITHALQKLQTIDLFHREK